MELLTISYWFWGNPPGSPTYGSPKVMALLAMCGFLIALSIGIRIWRKRIKNPVTKKLSTSWASAALWFGISGVVFVASRVEHILFLAMRFMWVLWGAFLGLFLFFQLRRFRQKHYEVLPKMKTAADPREKYLPTKKKHS